MSSGANSYASLPASYAYELVVHCGRWGVTPDAMLEGLDLTLDALKDPATRLDAPLFARLVGRGQELTGEPGLALSVGLHSRFSWHGFLGFAAMAASNLREALQIAEQFSATRTFAIGLSTHVEGDVASLVLEERLTLGALREFAMISLLIGIARVANDMTGKTLTGVAEFAFPTPSFVETLKQPPLQTGLLRFNQPANRLVFDAAYLDLPLVNADPAAMQLARTQCDRELAAIAETSGLVGRVRTELGRGDEGAFASLETVARRVGMSTRTFKRRLAEQGTTFTELQDDARRQRALLLLDDKRLSLGEVADRLGYSDVANFTRAFRRWTGRTPAVFRTR